MTLAQTAVSFVGLMIGLMISDAVRKYAPRWVQYTLVVLALAVVFGPPLWRTFNP